MKNHLFKTFFIILLLTVPALRIWSENSFASNLVPLEIQNSSTPSSASVHLHEAVALKLPEDITFIQGIEINIRIPKAYSYSGKNYIWTLYECGYTEENNSFNLKGEQCASGTFGNIMNLSIKIPFSSNHTIKKDPYSILLTGIPDFSGKQLYLCIDSPETKKMSQDQSVVSVDEAGNVTSASEEILIEVSAKPIFTNKGILKLNVYGPDKKPLTEGFTVYVDGKAFDSYRNLMIPEGTHSLSLMSDRWRTEHRSFTIEKATKTVLDIELTDIAPLVRISAPSNTVIYMDGNEIPYTSIYFAVTEGQHVFKMVTGDYECVRTLTAVNGRNYTISLNLEISITEDD